MLIPLLFRANLVSLTCGTWLAVAMAVALLSACGGGDPEPEPNACLDPRHTTTVRTGSGYQAHDVKIPAPACGGLEVM